MRKVCFEPRHGAVGIGNDIGGFVEADGPTRRVEKSYAHRRVVRGQGSCSLSSSTMVSASSAQAPQPSRWASMAGSW